MRNLTIPTLIAGLMLASSPLLRVAEAQDQGNVVRVKRRKIIIEVPVLVVVPQAVEAKYGKKEIRKVANKENRVLEGDYEDRMNGVLWIGGPYKGCYTIEVDLQLGLHFLSDGPPDAGEHRFRLSREIIPHERLTDLSRHNGLYGYNSSGDPYLAGMFATSPQRGWARQGESFSADYYGVIHFLMDATMSYLLQLQGDPVSDFRNLVTHLGQNAEKELAGHGKTLEMANKCLRGRYERELRGVTSNAKGTCHFFQRDEVEFAIDRSDDTDQSGTAWATHHLQQINSDGVELSEHIAHAFDFTGRDYGGGLIWGLEDKQVVFESTLRSPILQQSFPKQGFDYGGLGVTHEELADGFHQKVWETSNEGISVRHVLVVRITEAEAGDAGAVGMRGLPQDRTAEHLRFVVDTSNSKQIPTRLLSVVIGRLAMPPFLLVAQAAPQSDGERESEAACCGASLPEDVHGLIKVLNGPDLFRRRDAAQALGTLKAAPNDVLAALFNALQDEDYYVRQFSARAIGRIASPTSAATEQMRRATKDEEPLVRVAAAEAIWRIENNADAVLPVLTDGLTAPDPRARIASAAVLGQLGATARSAVPALQAAITANQPTQLRINAALALWQITDDATAANAILVDVLRTDSYRLKTAAIKAIATLGPEAKFIEKDLTEMLQAEPLYPGDPEAQSPAGRAQDVADLAARGVTDPGALLTAANPSVAAKDGTSIDAIMRRRIQQSKFIRKAMIALREIDDVDGGAGSLRQLMQSEHPFVSMEAAIAWQEYQGSPSPALKH